ncbi:hypothetical protein LTR72_011267 [Exophiala xenobiotica]|nr:hypothetical protein LTR72_011267 [Exophiala xenobiotica]
MGKEDIEFKTSDRVTLRGWFYTSDLASSGKAPCLVMSHGFSALKEMDLNTFAEHFIAQIPIHCLVYDNRGFGDSDAAEGEPRCEIVPMIQCSDMSDAITYAATRSEVNPDKIGIWGSSYSGGHVLYVGAADRRVKAVLSQVPCVSGWDNFKRLVRGDFEVGFNAAFAADRQGRLEGKEAGMVPVVDADPLKPSALPTPDSYEFFSAWEKKSNWKNSVTMRTHRSAKLRKPSQSPWKTIRSIIDKLAQDIQYVKEMVEGSGNNPGHDRSTGADDRNATPEDTLQILDQPPHERQQFGQNSPDTAELECTQNGGPISVDSSAKTDRQAIPTPLLSGLDMDENRAPSTPIPDQSCTAPTTVPTTVPTSVESSELEENTASVVTMPHRSSHPITSTISQSDTSAQSGSEIPRNPNITISYRVEQGVVVLMPLNMDQCRDTPFLFSQAEALGARETGVFKYVLPGDFELGAHAVPSITTRMSKFGSRLGPDDIFHISRTEDPETLEISETSFTPTEPDELSEILERRLAVPEAMSKMRYCTDLSVQTAEARRQLGLPAESPIWPLKGNMLDRTKYRVPGLHWPYGYVSGDDGSLFVIHREDGKLPSLNVLHCGREKLWYVVAWKDGYLVENEVKRGKCEQKVRHASRWIPRSKLKAMGASFVTLVQRPREVVVVWGDSYHQGGTVGPTVAEAVNYAGPNWSIEGYSACSRTCPGYPIPNALLEFRAPNEPQREQGDEDSQPVHDSIQSQGRERLGRNRAPTRDGKATESELRMNKQEARPRKRRGDVPIQQHSRKKTTIQTMHSSADTVMTETEIRNDLVSRMVTAIRSRDAIQQFLDIVHGRRDPEPTAIRIYLTTNASKRQLRIQDPAQMLENDVKFLSMLSR